MPRLVPIGQSGAVPSALDDDLAYFRDRGYEVRFERRDLHATHMARGEPGQASFSQKGVSTTSSTSCEASKSSRLHTAWERARGRTRRRSAALRVRTRLTPYLPIRARRNRSGSGNMRSWLHQEMRRFESSCSTRIREPRYRCGAVPMMTSGSTRRGVATALGRVVGAARSVGGRGGLARQLHRSTRPDRSPVPRRQRTVQHVRRRNSDLRSRSGGTG